MSKVTKLHNARPGSPGELREIIEEVRELVLQHADKGMSFMVMFSYEEDDSVVSEHRTWWKEGERVGFLRREHLVAELDRMKYLLQASILSEIEDE